MSYKLLLQALGLGLTGWGAANAVLAWTNYSSANVLPTPSEWLAISGPLLGAVVFLLIARRRGSAPSHKLAVSVSSPTPATLSADTMSAAQTVDSMSPIRPSRTADAAPSASFSRTDALLDALATLWDAGLGEEVQRGCQTLRQQGLPRQVGLAVTFRDGSTYTLEWGATSRKSGRAS